MDVGDHENTFVRRAFHLQVHGAADARTASISGHHPVALQRIGAFGGIDFQQRMAVFLLKLGELVAPAKVDQRLGLAGVVQVLLQELLLDVDDRKEPVIVVVRCFHAEHALAPVKRIAKAPGQAACGHAVGHAHLLQDFHRTAREANRPAALRELQLGRQHHAGHAMARQLQCRDHAGRACADDHDFFPVLLWVCRGQPRFENLVLVVERRAGFGAGGVHGLVM